jgi:hypothetical protein
MSRHRRDQSKGIRNLPRKGAMPREIKAFAPRNGLANSKERMPVFEVQGQFTSRWIKIPQKEC